MRPAWARSAKCLQGAGGQRKRNLVAGAATALLLRDRIWTVSGICWTMLLHLATSIGYLFAFTPRRGRPEGVQLGSMVSITRRYGLWTGTIGGLGLIVLLTGLSFGLQSPIKPESCPAGPTAAKHQSKLWFNDGTWWGILFDGSSEEYHIYRYDEAKEAWSDTGTLVDARNASRADALWDGPHLYVVSGGTEASLEQDSARFLRYTYDPSAGRYTLDTGFPVTIAEGGTEAISLARAADGVLWATY